jgi:ribonuclease VapC
MFVDASAMVAMLTREAEADVFLDIVEKADAPIRSAIAIFEATAGICRKRRSSLEQAHDDVRQFPVAANIRVADISDIAGSQALSAFARYGKGRGHPAQLNLGDCFAYAIAKLNGVPMLFKGDDFSKTDIASARS